MNMHVLHITSAIDPIFGGAAVALAGLAREQARRGMNVSIAATYVTEPGDAAARELSSSGVQVHRLGPCRNPMSRHPAMREFLQPLVERADVVHIHALWEAVQYQSGIAAQACSRPYVVSPHGMLAPWSMSRGWLKKRLYTLLRLRRVLDHAEQVVFTTTMEQRLASPYVPANRGIVIPIGLSTDGFSDLPPLGTFRSRFPELGNRPYLLCMARIDRQKGQDLLIESLARLTHSEVHLVLAGPDTRGESGGLKRLATQLGVAERVLFTGMLSGQDRLSAYRDASLFVLPSRHENFGIAVIEAVAAGCPVVISDQVNIQDEIQRSGMGRVVPLDIHQISHAIDAALEDRNWAGQVQAGGLAFVREHYDWEHVVKLTKTLYAGLTTVQTAPRT